jgi:hypothetical protein
MKYFISYRYQRGDYEAGYGNTVVEVDDAIYGRDDVASIEREISERDGLSGIVITTFIKLEVKPEE